MNYSSLLFAAVLTLSLTRNAAADVGLVPRGNQVDVTIDGKVVTTYRFDPGLAKPVLFPLLTPDGVKLTRDWPLFPADGGSKDHPHHTGLFFTVDEVNGNKFWGNTEGLPRIVNVRITKEETDKEKGVLEATLSWIGGDGRQVLEETCTMTFMPRDGGYAVDFDIALATVDTTVVFGDTKEGMFAIRVADWLREDTGTGKYISSRGGASSDVIWGRRAEWVALEGNRDGVPCGVAIFHHPTSANYPTFWHARNYGLFSANPLGQFAFESGTKVENPSYYRLTLKPGEKAVFKFRVLVFDGARTQEECEKEFQSYSASR